MNDVDIENKIKEKGLNAPRITMDHVNSMVDTVQFHRFHGTNTIVCCITLTNGYTVTGESSCVSSDNFDEDIGKDIAFGKAKDKIWMLEGYLLNHTLNSEGG